MAAGQSVTVNIPLRLRNFDQLKKDLNQIATGTAASDLANANLRKAGNLRAFIFDASNYHLVPTGQPSVQLAKIIAHSPAKNPWIATTLKIDAQGNRQYYAAPAEVQNAIPQDLSNYVSFTDAYGNPTNEFYTDGHYKLDLNAIFNWIKGLGYSVNVNSDNSLWQDYSYNNNPVNNTNWTVDTKPSDQVPEKQQTNSYFEVQKVFTTKDLKLANGANWNSNDNLAAASIYFTDKVSMKRVGSKNLMEKGAEAYTYRVVDAQGKVVADSSSVAAGKDIVLPAGTYTVTYAYALNNGEAITKNATITVAAAHHDNSDTPAPTPNPETPAKPKNNRHNGQKQAKNAGFVAPNAQKQAASQIANKTVKTAAKGQAEAASLPQTGASTKSTSILAIFGLLMSLMGLAVAGKKKRN